jgi:hypothetical protein
MQLATTECAKNFLAEHDRRPFKQFLKINCQRMISKPLRLNWFR